jgi:hypothetical protein
MTYQSRLKDICPSAPELEDDESCIYSLLNDGHCLYVGQTINPRGRLYTHLAAGKVFDTVEFSVCKSIKANQCEADTIVKMNPSLNKTLPSSKKYTSMSSFKKIVLEVIDENSNLVVFQSFPKQYLRTDIAKKAYRYIAEMPVDDFINAIDGKGGGS